MNNGIVLHKNPELPIAQDYYQLRQQGLATTFQPRLFSLAFTQTHPFSQNSGAILGGILYFSSVIFVITSTGRPTPTG